MADGEAQSIETVANQSSEAAGILFVSSRRHQALHRAAIVFRGDVSLGTVLGDDVGKTSTHDDAANRSGDSPVHFDLVCLIFSDDAEIDKPSLTDPVRGETIARLVSADGLGEHDVQEPDEAGKF